jgi:hypothetical protein
MLFAPRRRTKMSAVFLLLAAVPVFADPSPQDPADAGATSITLPAIEVISQQLEAARCWGRSP